MMKRNHEKWSCFLLLLTFWLGGGTSLLAQDFKITKFEENLTDLSAARADVKDRNGDPCALIKFSVRDLGFEYEPNLGVVKKEQRVGETWLFVPAGTKRITIRHPELGMLRNYTIPVTIEKKVVYEAEIQITNEEYLLFKRQAERSFHMNLGVGFNVVSIMGPSAYLGFSFKNHSLEAGVVYGLSKEWGVSIFQSENGAFWGLYDYSVLRLTGRYGYDIEVSDFLITPQVGVAANIISGTEVRASSVSDMFSKSTTLSATVGCRLSYCLGKYVRLQLTPEYDLGINKPKGYEIIKQSSTTIQSWTDGFSLNAGVAFRF